MADLLASQEQLKRAIERSLTNLKKLGKANWTVPVLHTRIHHLQTQWKDFEVNDAKLAVAISPEDQKALAYFKDQHFATTEEMYLQTLSFMSTTLADLKPKEVSPPEPLTNPLAASMPSIAHLPSIPLPPFDGRCEDWEAFRDRFQSLIIANPLLSKFSRMHYLVSSIKGSALGCIGDLSVTAANFDVAWQALKDRYDNPRRLLAKHLSTLLNLRALSPESASELQNLRDRIKLTLSSLRNLGRSDAELWNDFLVHIASQNLDSTTRKAWTLNTNEDTTPPTFEAFEKFLDARIRALADFDSSATCLAGSSSTNSAPRPSRHFAQTHVANQLQTADLCCPVCRSRHYLGKCPSFLGKSPQQRRDIAKRFSRCLNCLSLNHTLSNCARTEASSTVLLATARVQVRVPSGRSVTIRALIDQGSEASFVTESVVQLLRAKRLPVTTSISAVGGVHAGTVRHAASLLVSSRVSSEPSIQINALILGSVSTYKPSRVRNWQTLKYLVDLSWADHDPSSQDPIQMILGADVYPRVILNGLRKGHNAQPIAQKPYLAGSSLDLLNTKFFASNLVASSMPPSRRPSQPIIASKKTAWVLNSVDFGNLRKSLIPLDSLLRKNYVSSIFVRPRRVTPMVVMLSDFRFAHHLLSKSDNRARLRRPLCTA